LRRLVDDYDLSRAEPLGCEIFKHGLGAVLDRHRARELATKLLSRIPTAVRPKESIRSQFHVEPLLPESSMKRGMHTFPSAERDALAEIGK
jgi:hypothetical protein